MKIILAVLLLCSAALAQNECPSGNYAPSWGKFTDSSGVLHQTVCIDINSKLTFPLLNSISPTTMALSGTGSVGTPALSIGGSNTPGIFNDTSFLGMGLVYAAAARIYVISFGVTIGSGVYGGAATINGAPDVGISRCGIATYCIGNGSVADATGTLNAAQYQIGGVSIRSQAAVLMFGCRGTSAAASSIFLDSGTCIGGVGYSFPVSPGTITNLRCAAATAGVNASSGVVSVRKNGVTQATTCTFGTTLNCSDTTHSFSAASGDKLDIIYTSQAAETLAQVTCTLDKQ